MNPTISLIADYSSLIGLLISVLGLGLTWRVFQDVKRIENNYMFKANAPRLTDKLIEHQMKLNDFLNDFNSNRSDAEIEVLKAGITVKSLVTVIDKNAQTSLLNLSSLLVAYKDKQEEKELRIIYNSIVCVVAELEEEQELKSWKR